MSANDHSFDEGSPFEVSKSQAAQAAQELRAAASEAKAQGADAVRNLEPDVDLGEVADETAAKAQGIGHDIAEKARELSHSASEKINELKHTATEKGSELKNTASERANQLKDDAGERSAQFKNAAEEHTSRLRQEAEQHWLQTRERAGSARREAEDYVRANPLPTVVGALALGVVIGAILRR